MDENKYVKVTRLKKSIISLFFVILACLSIKIPIVFSIYGILAIFFAIEGFKKKQRLGIFNILVIIVGLIIIISSAVSNHKITKDPNEENILVGSWEYNNVGGLYQFNSDMTYAQYSNSDKTDNYCEGTYTYEYGFETDEGLMKRYDNDFIYYHLILTPVNCVINKSSDNSEESSKIKHMVFCYSKTEEVKPVIINSQTDLIFALTKLE